MFAPPLRLDEEEQVNEKFALKLANAELAEQFVAAFNSAKQPMQAADTPSSPKVSCSQRTLRMNTVLLA
eukprot:1026597-Amphidinium_carterae.1